MKCWFIEILIQWKINEIFCSFFNIPSLWNPVHILHFSTSQFILAAFQVLSGHMWLVATKSDSTALEHLSLLSHISVEDSSTRNLFWGDYSLAIYLYLCSSIIEWKMKNSIEEKTILNHICFINFSPLQKLVLLKKCQYYWMRTLEGSFSWCA